MAKTENRFKKEENLTADHHHGIGTKLNPATDNANLKRERGVFVLASNNKDQIYKLGSTKKVAFSKKLRKSHLCMKACPCKCKVEVKYQGGQTCLLVKLVDILAK